MNVLPQPQTRCCLSVSVVRWGCLGCGWLALTVLLAAGWPAEIWAEIRAEDGHGGHAVAHVEVGHQPPAGMKVADFESPAEFRSDLAIYSFLVFLLLLGLLTKFAWKPIMQGLEKREQGIAAMLAATQAASDNAQQMLASYERRLATAADEVRAMLDEARRDADTTRQTIIAEARVAAGEEQTRARVEIGAARDEALAQIADKAGHLAIVVASKFLREKMGHDDQARLLQESLTSLTGNPSRN